MKQKHRRIIFIIFVALFLISVPFILFYTSGWRYNVKKSKFEKTGSIVVNTKTENITLYLNESQYFIKDELRIKHLLPDDYMVKIEKDGYYIWQKELKVESQLTTFIKDFRLFKQNLPINLDNKEILDIYPSPKNNKLAYSTYNNETKNYEILVLTAGKDNISKLYNTEYQIKNITWSQAETKIIANTESGFKIIDIREEKLLPLPLNTKIDSLAWDKENDNLIFAKIENKIYKIDLIFNSDSHIYTLPFGIDNFAISNNKIYYIYEYNLRQVDLASNAMLSIPLERKTYKIDNILNKKIFLISAKGKIQVFGLPLEKRSAPILFANAKSFDISGDMLLFYNDFELWKYDFKTGEKELITRIGANIKKAGFLAETQYVLFLLENSIKAIETKKTGERQTLEFIKFEKIEDMILDKNFNIYFIGKMNSSEGLFKLEI